MEAIDFFHGTRVQPSLVIPFYEGKAELECTISEGWGQLILHSIRCGDKYVRKLKRSIGMVYTEKDDLESLVSGSLGLKGIASLDSQISSKIGVELQLSRSEEIEDEFTFEAPTCGERIVGLYQLRRNITLRFQDSRLFHKKEWSMSTTYWADRIHDNSHMVPKIPECGCKDDTNQLEDGRLYVDMGNVTLTTEFIENANSIRISSLDMEIEKLSLHKPIQIQRNKIPDYLLFLAGNTSEVINAKVYLSKYPDNNSDEELPPNVLEDSFLDQTEYKFEKIFKNHNRDLPSTPGKGLVYTDALKRLKYVTDLAKTLDILDTYLKDEQKNAIFHDAFSVASNIKYKNFRSLALNALTPFAREDQLYSELTKENKRKLHNSDVDIDSK